MPMHERNRHGNGDFSLKNHVKQSAMSDNPPRRRKMDFTILYHRFRLLPDTITSKRKIFLFSSCLFLTGVLAIVTISNAFIVWVSPKTISCKKSIIVPEESLNTTVGRRRVYISGNYIHVSTGGPEALIQLALAFRSFLGNDLVFLQSISKRGYHEWFREQYGVKELSDISLSHCHEDVRPGDIYIIPEIEGCPVDLVKKGVFVYRWLLGTNMPQVGKSSLTNGCRLLSHNFWLGANPYSFQKNRPFNHKFWLGKKPYSDHKQWHVGPALPLESVLRPYITPSLVIPEENITIDKENLVLIDNDTPYHVKSALSKYCKELNCTATRVEGFARSALPALFNQAKIVVDWCMVGSERMPIESGLWGAVLLSSSCLCVQDYRDYPIPKRNIVNDEGDELKQAVKRILENYQQEFKDYVDFRALYRNLNSSTLTLEAKSFYLSHDKEDGGNNSLPVF